MLADDGREPDRSDSDELLRRALLDSNAAAAVSLNVGDLPLSDNLTVVFHGRRDLGFVQTYVAHGTLRAGESVGPEELLRVPCDLDLGDASGLEEAEQLYAEQASVLREAMIGADTVLDIWRDQLSELLGSPVTIDRSIELDVDLPAHRLLPIALTAKEQQMFVVAVCGARTLSQGRPPLGIVCVQHDVSRVYPLLDDPRRCVEDFGNAVAKHAELLHDRIRRQEASVERFLELSEDSF